MGVDPADDDEAERTVEVDGRTWFVRVVGESRGGRTLNDVGLVELEFEPVDAGTASQRRLIVRESGREIGDLELEELLKQR